MQFALLKTSLLRSSWWKGRICVCDRTKLLLYINLQQKVQCAFTIVQELCKRDVN